MSKNNKKMMLQMGMWGSLVGTISTGFIDKRSHILLSTLFIGFIISHYLFYKPIFKKDKKIQELLEN
ncbi:MAG: hypothetical protein HQK72_02820 [Desulfamplus sp.]|nr:hypothetical protein [Desulfamplus sp.]